MRPALIGLAHGSRHPDVVGSLDRLTRAVADRAEELGDPVRVETAFLDLVEPNVVAVAHRLRADEVRQAVAVPLLFTSAFHATVDVPAGQRQAIAETGLDLRVAPIIGTGDDLVVILENVLISSAIPAEAELILYAVGSSDQEANAAVDDLAGRLEARRGRRVQAAFATRSPKGPDLLAELADSTDSTVAVVSLFVSPGLLLDPMRRAAERHQVPMTGPLEGALADLVLSRYRVVGAGFDGR